MAHVIAQPCIGVKQAACVDVCPEHCIYDAGAQCVIDPGACTDCRRCVPVCPVAAIFAASDLPARWREFAATNAERFAR